VLKQAQFYLCCIGGALYAEGSAWQTVHYEEMSYFFFKEVSSVEMASV